MQRFTVAEAINLLRPHFAERDAIRTALLAIICNTQTYFATIPRDITNIIAEFVPTLRQTYTQDYINELLRIYTNYASNHDAVEYKHNTVLCTTPMNWQKCSATHQLIPDLTNRSLYIGQDRIIPRNFEQSINTKWFRMDNGKLQSCNIRELWLLPCDILIVRYSNYRDRINPHAPGIPKYRINNHLAIDANDFSKVIRLKNIGDNTDFANLYDDYGDLVDTELPYAVLRFSIHTPEPAAFHTK